MDSLQLDLICTYKLMTEDEEEEIGIKQMLYQFQLLQAFRMTDYNDSEINNKMQTLYQQLKNVEFVKILIQKNPHTNYFKEEEELIFRTLFSYDYFDLFHKCLYYHSKNESVDNAMGLLLEEFNRN
jgi:hypothetical protein